MALPGVFGTVGCNLALSGALVTVWCNMALSGVFGTVGAHLACRVHVALSGVFYLCINVAVEMLLNIEKYENCLCG